MSYLVKYAKSLNSMSREEVAELYNRVLRDRERTQDIATWVGALGGLAMVPRPAKFPKVVTYPVAGFLGAKGLAYLADKLYYDRKLKKLDQRYNELENDITKDTV